jgi:hypothetical protein
MAPHVFIYLPGRTIHFSGLEEACGRLFHGNGILTGSCAQRPMNGCRMVIWYHSEENPAG